MFNTSHDPTLPNVFCFALIARLVTAITHCAFNRTQHESAVSSCTKLALERVFISVSLRVCVCVLSGCVGGAVAPFLDVRAAL